VKKKSQAKKEHSREYTHEAERQGKSVYYLQEISTFPRQSSPNDTWRDAMSVKPGQSANKSQARWILSPYFRWKRRYAIAKAQYVCNILPLMCGSPVESGSSANQTSG
jgi:hypothetical protein